MNACTSAMVVHHQFTSGVFVLARMSCHGSKAEVLQHVQGQSARRVLSMMYLKASGNLVFGWQNLPHYGHINPNWNGN
jgi:hypothetical protein